MKSVIDFMFMFMFFTLLAKQITAHFDVDRVVNHINEYRRLHQSSALIYSAKISEFSQSWADHMSINRVFEHSDENKYGENIALSYDIDTEAFIRSIDAFYNESSLYDYNKPGFSLGTGHFTQLVWSNTREIGLGISNSTKGYTYICTNYYPPGNYMGKFQYNVKPVLFTEQIKPTQPIQQTPSIPPSHPPPYPPPYPPPFRETSNM